MFSSELNVYGDGEGQRGERGTRLEDWRPNESAECLPTPTSIWYCISLQASPCSWLKK